MSESRDATALPARPTIRSIEVRLENPGQASGRELLIEVTEVVGNSGTRRVERTYRHPDLLDSHWPESVDTRLWVALVDAAEVILK